MVVYYKLPKSKYPGRIYSLSGVIGVYTTHKGTHWCFVSEYCKHEFPKDKTELFAVSIGEKEVKT